MGQGAHLTLMTTLSSKSSMSNLMYGRNPFPILLDIRLVRWSPILSLFSKLSRSAPHMDPSSATPISRSPPSELRKATIVFRTAFSILLSVSPVSRFVRRVDLNSSLFDSPDSMSLRVSAFSMSLIPRASELISMNDPSVYLKRSCLSSS